MKRLLVVVVAALVWATPAFAQTQPAPVPIREALDAVYALGLQTGQSVTGMLKEQDERLKWVLDNWVSKQPNPSK